MNETPETLREVADRAASNMIAPQLLHCHAAAWEKLQHDYDGLTEIADGLYYTVIEVVAENEKLEKRLEAASIDSGLDWLNGPYQDILDAHYSPEAVAMRAGEEKP